MVKACADIADAGGRGVKNQRKLADVIFEHFLISVSAKDSWFAFILYFWWLYLRGELILLVWGVRCLWSNSSQVGRQTKQNYEEDNNDGSFDVDNYENQCNDFKKKLRALQRHDIWFLPSLNDFSCKILAIVLWNPYIQIRKENVCKIGDVISHVAKLSQPWLNLNTTST